MGAPPPPCRNCGLQLAPAAEGGNWVCDGPSPSAPCLGGVRVYGEHSGLARLCCPAACGFSLCGQCAAAPGAARSLPVPRAGSVEVLFGAACGRLLQGRGAARCAAGHPLVPAPDSGCSDWLCDGSEDPEGCPSLAKAGVARHSCALCNYDLCGPCLSRRLRAALGAARPGCAAAAGAAAAAAAAGVAAAAGSGSPAPASAQCRAPRRDSWVRVALRPPAAAAGSSAPPAAPVAPTQPPALPPEAPVAAAGAPPAVPPPEPPQEPEQPADAARRPPQELVRGPERAEAPRESLQNPTEPVEDPQPPPPPPPQQQQQQQQQRRRGSSVVVYEPHGQVRAVARRFDAAAAAADAAPPLRRCATALPSAAASGTRPRPRRSTVADLRARFI
eukprot:TRINITY_DN7924_c0_g1_i1.p2 TRINITY_DN7924_c0_g1~~TRINITY_DN7924_c0_g1_i1.p2  ORF type:complete len:446 (+),score=87.31 TRINITY_DN7924_c0_g1_i1:177-1340(+)